MEDQIVLSIVGTPNTLLIEEEDAAQNSLQQSSNEVTIEPVPEPFNVQVAMTQYYLFYVPTSEEKIYDQYRTTTFVEDATTPNASDTQTPTAQGAPTSTILIPPSTIANAPDEGLDQVVESIHSGVMTSTAEQGAQQQVAISLEEEKLEPIDHYGFYNLFRTRRLKNPFIRSRLIKRHVSMLRSKYEPIYRWISHIKLLASLFLPLFTVLLAIKLDDYLLWPFFFIYLPFAAFAGITLILIVLMWLPTLNWPLALYRWVMKDQVGWWTSWAYALTVRGRFVQLISGSILCLAVIYGLFTFLFPIFLPEWSPLAMVGGAFFIWMYTSTQIIYEKAKRFYPWVILVVAISMLLFALGTVLKLVFLDTLFKNGLLWTVTSFPLFVAVAALCLYQIKLSAQLNTVTARYGCCWFWNMGFLCVVALSVSTLTMTVLRLDNFVKIPFIICFSPALIVEMLISCYYFLRAFTRHVPHGAYKNPFTMIGQGGVNTSDMESFVI